MKPKVYEPIQVEEWDADFDIGLDELLQLIPILQSRYGAKARISFYPDKRIEAYADELIEIYVTPTKVVKNA